MLVTFNFGRSRGTSVGSSTVVQDGDDLGFITWSAADGTDLVLVRLRSMRK